MAWQTDGLTMDAQTDIQKNNVMHTLTMWESDVASLVEFRPLI